MNIQIRLFRDSIYLGSGEVIATRKPEPKGIKVRITFGMILKARLGINMLDATKCIGALTLAKALKPEKDQFASWGTHVGHIYKRPSTYVSEMVSEWTTVENVDMLEVYWPRTVHLIEIK